MLMFYCFLLLMSILSLQFLMYQRINHTLEVAMIDTINSICYVMIVLSAVSGHGHQVEADHLLFYDCQLEAPANLYISVKYLTYLLFHAGYNVKISVYSSHIYLHGILLKTFMQWLIDYEI